MLNAEVAQKPADMPPATPDQSSFSLSTVGSIDLGEDAIDAAQKPA